MIKIIQISDFHNVETTANKMMRQKVCESIRNINPDILLFTGDLHNYGENFEPFKNYINDLMSEGELTSKDVFIVPGNHDIDRELSKNEEKNRKAYIGCILGEVEKDTDCYKIYIEELAACFKGFNNTMNEVLGEAYKTDTVYHYIWNKRINIITLNTALISDGRDHQQIIDTNKLADLNPCNGLPTIIIGHHDMSCLFDSHQSILKSLMASWKVSFYLCGDRHKNKQGLLDDVMCNNVKIPVIVAGKGSVENHDNYSDVSFLVYEIDEESNNVNLSLCNWDNEKKTFVSGIFENNELKPSFELRYSPKRKKSSKSKLPRLYENDELEAMSELQHLKEENAALRSIIDGKVVSLPADYIDDKIFKAAGTEDIRVSQIVYEIISKILPRHLMFITCRIRQLVDMGEFEIIKYGKLTTEVYGGGDDFMKSVIRRRIQ